jgi:glycogen debranching enzyme
LPLAAGLPADRYDDRGLIIISHRGDLKTVIAGYPGFDWGRDS